MAVAIDWSLLKPVDFAGAVQTGFERGRQMRLQRDQEGALAALARNPDDPEARGVLWRTNPAVASAFEASALKRAEAGRETEARGALADWVMGGGQVPQRGAFPQRNALLTGPAPTTPALGAFGSTNALAVDPQPTTPALGGARPNALLPDAAAQASPPTAALRSGPPEHDYAAGDAAWERYVRADPSGAMKTMLERANLTKAQNEALTSQYDIIARLARGAVDQESYTKALQEAQSHGIDTSSLPQQFDENAVNAIELQALSAKEYLAEQRDQRRLDWNIEDDRIDNARADRSEARQEYYRSRSDQRGERADARAGVRFKERALDRAALAGVRSDISDLDY